MSESKLISKILDAYSHGTNDKRNNLPYNNIYKKGKGKEAYKNGYYTEIAIANINKEIRKNR